MYLLKIGSTELAMPSKYQTETQEILASKSGRNAKGNMIKKRINTKMSISVEWTAVTQAEKDSIISLTSANTFSLTYYSLETNAYVTGTFYRGNDYKMSPLLNFTTSEGFTRFSISMSLVEM